MTFIKKSLISLASLGVLIISTISHAHLMVAEHGTLNFVDKNVYIVLSLPISAFKGLDHDKDGHVSLLELNANRQQVSATIIQNIYLMDHKKKFTIDGLLLNPSIAHHEHVDNHAQQHLDDGDIDQLTIMGRYSLPSSTTKVNFNIKLFSDIKTLQHYQITAINKKQKLNHQFDIKPTSLSIPVF